MTILLTKVDFFIYCVRDSGGALVYIPDNLNLSIEVLAGFPVFRCTCSLRIPCPVFL